MVDGGVKYYRQFRNLTIERLAEIQFTYFTVQNSKNNNTVGGRLHTKNNLFKMNRKSVRGALNRYLFKCKILNERSKVK